MNYFIEWVKKLWSPTVILSIGTIVVITILTIVDLSYEDLQRQLNSTNQQLVVTKRKVDVLFSTYITTKHFYHYVDMVNVATDANTKKLDIVNAKTAANSEAIKLMTTGTMAQIFAENRLTNEK